MSIDSDPIEQFLTLLENPKVQAFFDKLIDSRVEKRIQESYQSTEFKTAVDNTILESELELPSRVRAIEKTTGHYQFEDFEEHEPTLPEQITELKEKLTKGCILPLEPEEDNRETFDPTSKVKKSFVELIKYVESRPVIDGKKSITNSLLKHFRKHVLPEKLRPKESAAREWKSELQEIIKQEASYVKFEKRKNGDSRGTAIVFPRNFDTKMLKCKLPVSY